jgi:hypothetical protein
MEVAKRMTRDSLPIKCLEAVILSIYLINEIPQNANNGLEKFTIGFKTVSNNNIHRHVVLGIYDHNTQLFGSLGISRRDELGFKPLKYEFLTDLLNDYINSYKMFLHKVKRIKLGNSIPKSNRSFESLPWNGCTINLKKDNSDEWPKLVEKHARQIRNNGGVVGSYLNYGITNLRPFYSMRSLTALNSSSSRLQISSSIKSKKMNSGFISARSKSQELSNGSCIYQLATPFNSPSQIELLKQSNGNNEDVKEDKNDNNNNTNNNKTSDTFNSSLLTKRKKQSLRI